MSLASRQIYKSLLDTLPPTKPPNWTRSRIRRQHLITLGIPVNLDEVLPRANGKPLPTLEIHTRPMSAPPGARNLHQVNGTHTSQNSRSGTPQPGQQAIHAQFGPKPELEMGKINKLLQLSQGLTCSYDFVNMLLNYSFFRNIDFAAIRQSGTLSCRAQTTDSQHLQPFDVSTPVTRCPPARQ